ncbi:MAG: MotA/TolQ/ExbB proton channel family protein [Gammaproteobacteria bacterium]|jgi:biopolymer transport protein ExbB
MRKLVSIAASTLLAAGLGLSGTAVAQEAASLDELLNMVRQGQAREAREAEQRLAEFRRRQSEQQALLNQASNERASLEQTGEQLEALFEENNRRLATAAEELDERLGSLKELFGVLQQVAGDTQSVFGSSLISAQYPDREEFLVQLGRKMASSTQLASIEDIERLWFELQRQMTESGKVAKFERSVILADGTESTIPVVRVGPFNIVGDGYYLNYTPETGNVVELQRQPDQARYTQSTAALFDAQEGPVTFGLDPTRGGILAQLVDRPTLRERIDQGGIVGYSIIGLGILGLLIALVSLFSLVIADRKVSAQLKSDKPNSNNPLGRVLGAYEDNKNVDTETLELKLSEAVLKEAPKLSRGLLFVKVISVVAPLAGLLGTVTGMIKTFQVITLYGAGDPKLMAGGISQALVTTVLGLVVAIPMVLLHTFLQGRSKRILNILQEQSAGIIAEHSEAEHRSAG